MSTTNHPSNPAPASPTKKKKGFIRWEALVPFAIFIALVWAYFFFFFDLHLRKAIEFGGYQALGAEVNVADVKTSFWKANLHIKGIQCTDPDQPNKNMLEIGDIRFGMEWDALLRAKVLVNEAAVEGIKIGTPRRSAGKVKPPEPIQEGPSKLEQEAERLKNKALESTQKSYENNILGDIAAMLSGTSGEDQLKNIEGTLVSKTQLAAFEKAYQDKAKAWDERFKALPKPQEIQALGDRLGQIKTKDFKTPQELADSLKQFDEIIKEADQKAKSLQAASNDISSDLKFFENGLKELEAQIKKDMADLEARFRLPKLDASAISKSLFSQYLDPYLSKISRYRSLIEKYAPPAVIGKGKGEPDPAMQPRPRTQGISYEFGRPNSYPLFWVKKISVSSQAGAEPGSGNVAGLITDVTSNQVLTRKPTVARLTGDFPSDQIEKILAQISLDNTKERSEVLFDFEVGSYPVEGRSVVDSPEVKLAFQQAQGSVKARGQLLGLRDLTFDLANQVQKVSYDIEAQNSTVQEILQGIFKGIPTVGINASIDGRLPNVKIDVNSNLGEEIKKGFEQQLQKKINEARTKIEAYINQTVGQEKAKVEAEITKLKSQADNDVKKLQAQLDSQKTQAQAKIDEAKRKFEDQAKQGAQKEVEKAAQDLKKKLGW